MIRIVVFGLVSLFAVTAQAATVETYLRHGDQQIEVAQKDGKLFCTRVSDGFELCNGMTRNDDGTWGGAHMKHPDMPFWARFNGTVIFKDDSLKIIGCVLGFCDSETWKKG